MLNENVWWNENCPFVHPSLFLANAMSDKQVKVLSGGFIEMNLQPLWEFCKGTFGPASNKSRNKHSNHKNLMFVSVQVSHDK